MALQADFDIKTLKNSELVAKMMGYEEIFWLNEGLSDNPLKNCKFQEKDIDEAEARLERFRPYIMKAFPETEQTPCIIESDLVEIPNMKKELIKLTDEFSGRLFLKKDSHLPVSGSIKARGGIYEVLKFAEKIALEKKMLSLEEDYSKLLNPEFTALFSQYSVAVGSTGNLGLSIGIISAKLGFKVTVHMSADAKAWKKDLLRSKGVTVIEYPEDYQVAVSHGRKKAESDPMCHFVDDEGSEDLFLGYSVAGKRIRKQFLEANILCDDTHPVFVYIPCGVGGAPGGVAFGLKNYFGKNIHIFFAEPTHAPCMTLGLATGLKDKISCNQIGIDGLTEADGLAVGRASNLVSELMETMLSGAYTIDDKKLYPFLSKLKDSENIFIEPSSCASFIGPALVCQNSAYLKKLGLTEEIMKNATHILWGTGGNMVPEREREDYYERGK